MTSVLIFLLVLSVLIFVHELGHFLAAKACNVYVDRFSIGMPPRILGFKYGETDYCIGALPFGGFVKMAGQEDAPLTEEERERDYGNVPPERWFNKRPVWQRIIILVAGPFMNVLLAGVIYAGLFAWGVMVMEGEVNARLGEIAKDSPAQSAPMYAFKDGAGLDSYAGTPDAVGWKTGDVVVSIDGTPVDKFEDVLMETVLGGENHKRLVVLDRENADGTTTRFASVVVPKKITDKDKYPRFGVAPFSTAMVGEVLEGMPGKDAGLQSGDVIERLDGERVDRDTFIAKVEKTDAGKTLDLLIKRGDQKLNVAVTPRTIGRILDVVFGPEGSARGDAADAARPMAYDVSEDYQKKTGLKRKDVIATINGQPATMKLLGELERSAPDAPRDVTVARPAIAFGLIQKAEELKLSLPVDSARAVGVALKPVLVFHRTPISEVLPAAFTQARKDVERTVGTVVALVKRDVSVKDIGGPVMIFSVTSAAAEEGFSRLLKIMAFISVNLCVFNLLPLPILDGGQIVINLVEGIRRRPVSPAFMERFQMVGFLLIVGLMLFVTWNDVKRIITSLTP